MKIILEPIFLFIFWVLAVIIGIIYSVLYFIYNPKGMIKEKINNLERKDVPYTSHENYLPYDKRPIDWWATIKSYDFHCPFINS